MTPVSRSEAEEILGICRYEAKRFARRSRVLEPDDAAQEAALAILVVRARAAEPLEGGLMRIVARRRIVNATRDELVRKRQPTGARVVQGAFRVLLEAVGFSALEARGEEAAEVILAHDPWPAWERTYTAVELSRRRVLCWEPATRQAEHARLKRAASWYKKNRFPFDL